MRNFDQSFFKIERREPPSLDPNLIRIFLFSGCAVLNGIGSGDSALSFC